jgi:hypothetical protein
LEYCPKLRPQIDSKHNGLQYILLAPGKYEQWVKAFSEHSQFEGRWEAGATVKFVDPNMGGSKAILEIFEPPHCILAKHIAMILALAIQTNKILKTIGRH